MVLWLLGLGLPAMLLIALSENSLGRAIGAFLALYLVATVVFGVWMRQPQRQ